MVKPFTLDPKPEETTRWSWRHWQRIQTFVNALQNALQQLWGYGGMRLTAPRAGADIGDAWQLIAPYDALSVEPYGCSFDLTAGTFTLDRGGVWRISLYSQLLVNNSGSVRSIEFRLINANTGLQIGQTFVAECQARIASVSFTGVYDLTTLQGIPIALQVRTDDSFSTVTWTQQNLSVDYAGPIPGQRDLTPPLRPVPAGQVIE